MKGSIMTGKTTTQKAAEAGAKTPTDHAVKAAEAEAMGGPVHVTVRGIDLTINPESFKDWRIARKMARGDAGAQVDVWDLVVGDKEAEVDAILAEDDGRVPPEAVQGFLAEVFEAAGLEGLFTRRA